MELNYSNIKHLAATEGTVSSSLFHASVYSVVKKRTLPRLTSNL